MAKAATKTMRKPSSKYAGTTSDGVRIMKPVVKPTSFTTAQIRKTVKEVLSRPEVQDAMRNVRPVKLDTGEA